MFRDDLLRGRVILVTGGGSGLGLAMARRFASLGAALVLAGRREAVLEEAAAGLRERGGTRVLTRALDVRDAGAVEAAMSESVRELGRVDVLVNNAAGNFLARTEELSPNAFAAVVGIVLQGTFHASAAFARHVIARGAARGGGGTILNVVATYASGGAAFVVPSACAKAGVLAMTRSLAVEWARHGIRVNAIAPGMFPTDGAWERLVPDPSFVEEAVRRTPARRLPERGEIADLAAFLVADASRHITGDCVTMDGGASRVVGPFNALAALPDEELERVLEGMRRRREAERRRP